MSTEIQINEVVEPSNKTANLKKVTEADKDIIKAWYNEEVTSMDAFIKKLNEEFSHDYGTICHALAASAVQAAKMMDNQSQGGITGFQAGAVMCAFVKNWMHLDGPIALVQFEHMLYPQYHEKFDKTINEYTWKFLQETAKKRLEDGMYVHPDVKKHWQNIANGIVPFGYTVKD